LSELRLANMVSVEPFWGWVSILKDYCTLAGSATKSYNNKAVVYTKRGNATRESHYDYYTALKSCDKRQPLPIFMVPSI